MSIRLAGVQKAFGRKDVLKGFTLDVADGETAAIVGPSGSGKSVLLKHVVGLLRPDAGSVVVSGVSVPELKQGRVGAPAAGDRLRLPVRPRSSTR